MDIWEQICALRRDETDAVVVTIVAVRGSVPGQTGAKAVVTSGGLLRGNLGGGKVEAQAIARAMDLLGGGDPCLVLTWNLQRDVGMTCGGEMTFLFEKITASEPWHIAILGAGHVSQALVPVLATLVCRIDVCDTRPEWLEKFPRFGNVSLHHVERFEDGVDFLNGRSFVLSLTKGHSSDVPVLREVLRRFPGLPFLGVIGSASKKATLFRDLRDAGFGDELLEKIACPVGLPIGGNDPAEIAISIAAQLLTVRG